MPPKVSAPVFVAAWPKVASAFSTTSLPTEKAVAPFAIVVVPAAPTVSGPVPSAEALPIASVPALSVVPPV